MPDLLCAISYLFVEFHWLPFQRVNLTRYKLDPDLYEHLKSQIHSQMDRPACRLKVYWRSFWSAGGDVMRFQWRSSEQAAPRRVGSRNVTESMRNGAASATMHTIIT